MTSAALIREQATPDHKAAGRELAFALAFFAAQGGSDGFAGLAAAFRKYLSPGEAAMVAWAALRAVELEDIAAVLEAALPELPSGWPEAAFMLESAIDDAALWAEAAWPEERRAYAIAAASKMTPEERHALIRALGGVPG